MTNKEYREHEGISRSSLWTILEKTPAHFHYEEEHPKEDTAALAFGRAVHKLVLEPDEFFEEFAVAPKIDRRTSSGKAEWAEFCDTNVGKEILSKEDYDTAWEMATTVRDNPIAARFLEGLHEQSYFWTDSDTGEACKCRPDCLAEVDGKKYIVDYKTTDSCADGHFERSVRKYGYKFQAGFYREGMFQNTLDEYGFVFIAQEKSAPYAVRVYICTDEFINEGYDQFRKAIGLYHHCKETGNWFGYEGEANAISYLVEEGEQNG